MNIDTLTTDQLHTEFRKAMAIKFAAIGKARTRLILNGRDLRTRRLTKVMVLASQRASRIYLRIHASFQCMVARERTC